MRTIKNYEDCYHFDDNLNIVNSKTMNVKRPSLSSCKYLVVDMYKNGKRKTELLHRLIATTFIDNPMNYSDVNHIDGDKLNNSIENLEWRNRSQNIQHSYDFLGRKEKMNWKSGSANGKSKKVVMIDNLGNKVKTFDCIMDIERELGISNSSVCQCLKGKYKTAGGYKWEYAK